MSTVTSTPVGSDTPLVRALFRQVRRCFDAPPARVSQKQAAGGAGVKALVVKHLEAFDVPYFVGAPTCEAVVAGNVAVTRLCGGTVSPGSVAEFARRVCDVWPHGPGATAPLHIALALADTPKVLRHAAPLTMRDINSGATWCNEGLIIMFRFDADFWKTLLHELIHFVRRTKDEAETEFLALLVHAMIRSPSWAAFEAHLQEQQRLSQAVARKLRRVDAGSTNATEYWEIGAVCFLNNAEEVLAGRAPARRAHKHTVTRGARDTVLRVSCS